MPMPSMKQPPAEANAPVSTKHFSPLPVGSMRYRVTPPIVPPVPAAHTKPSYTSECRGGVERRQLKLKGVEGED
eukprot:31565-Pelagococcus_subviridis.AAC.3